MIGLVLRAATAGVPLVALVACLVYTRAQPVFETYYASTLAAVALWSALAVFVAVGPGGRRLAERLAGLARAGPGVWGLALAGGGALAWAVRVHALPYAAIPLVLAALHAAFASESPRTSALGGAVFVALTLLLLEGALFGLRHLPPGAVRSPFTALARALYQSEWHIAHAEPACGRFEPQLSYTLRPGRCLFQNDEFRTELRVNRAGLRDDEASLDAPEVIVLGDSYALGWGVEQDEAFPQRLEALTGARVLNAGVSSYGTARAMMLLERLDRSGLRALVIQYNANDFAENRTWQARGGSLPPRDVQWYEKLVATYQTRLGYRPGKYLRVALYEVFLPRVVQRMAALGWPLSSGGAGRGEARRAEAEMFLQILAAAPVDLAHVALVVLEINRRSDDDPPSPFLPSLAALAATDPRFAGVSHLRTLDVMAELDGADYFVLDGHLRAAGQAKVAGALANALARDLDS